MSITLRDTNFGSIFTASGTRNFLGEGWPYHKPFSLVPGFDFTGSTMITKTTTYQPRQGNMPLDKNLQPIEIKPECIYVNFHKGFVLNAVGLSGPGAVELLNLGIWQSLTKPFVISFMAEGRDQYIRFQELSDFCQLLKANSFKTKFGLEINISCPNVGNTGLLYFEIIQQINIVNAILSDVPVIIKINALIDPDLIKQIINYCHCEAIDVSNSIPYGQLPEKINWSKLIAKSPLSDYGGGGLSGKPLLTIVTDWIKRARDYGITVPIIGGGGILCKKDVLSYAQAGANAVSIGTVAILRPWRVKSIINYANKILV